MKETVKTAHGKLDPAVADAASHGQKFSAMEPLGYFLAVAVLEQLRPSGQKNVLGWFTGEAGTWEKIVAAYRKQGAVSICCNGGQHIQARQR